MQEETFLSSITNRLTVFPKSLPQNLSFRSWDQCHGLVLGCVSVPSLCYPVGTSAAKAIAAPLLPVTHPCPSKSRMTLSALIILFHQIVSTLRAY